MKRCNSEPRGDDIGKHIQKNSNLLVLDKANENQMMLRKSLEPCDATEQSEQYIKDLLVQTSDSEKMHTEYLFHHGYSSIKLPDFNSVNFKCQQKKSTIPSAFKLFVPLPKKAKMSEEGQIQPTPTHDTSTTKNVETIPREDSIDSQPHISNLETARVISPIPVQEEISTKLDSEEFIEKLASKIATKVIQVKSLLQIEKL